MRNEVNERSPTHIGARSSQGHRSGDLGWYLYGITRRSAEVLNGLGGDSVSAPGAGPLAGGAGPVRWVTCGDLAAVVREVPLADFSEEALASRSRDLDALEELASRHNAVIASIYQRQTILPAKFGHVYPSEDALRGALLGAHDALIAQLERLKACDEWAVHVYADPSAIEHRLLAEQQAVANSAQELGSARPGRAYLLKRKLEVELAEMTEQAIWDLTREIVDRLESLSLASEVTPADGTPSNSKAPREVLRAAFLVGRGDLEAFLEAVDGADREHKGLRCTRSGPWPPYSFAGLPPEDS